MYHATARAHERSNKPPSSAVEMAALKFSFVAVRSLVELQDITLLQPFTVLNNFTATYLRRKVLRQPPFYIDIEFSKSNVNVEKKFFVVT